MWKVLLMISAVVLIGSGVFSYMNKGTLESTRTDRQRNEAYLAKSLDELDKKRQDLAATEAETVKLKAENETLKTELAQATLKSTNNEESSRKHSSTLNTPSRSKNNKWISPTPLSAWPLL